MTNYLQLTITALGGLALFVYGMGLMSDGLKETAGEKLKAALGYMTRNRIFAILAGMAVTALIQSSSATIGITIALAETGVISLWTAVPIVLGDNIGTTITAALAAIGGNANARRTALAHALFNAFGTILVLLSFGLVFTNADGVAAPAFYQLVDLCTDGNGFAGETPGRHVAMAHTIFNVANVIVQTPFIPLLARLCTRLIGDDRTARVQALEPHLLEAPALALHAARLALGDMTRRAWTIASVALNNCLGRATVDEESVQNAEREIDEMQSRIRDYLVAISQRKLTERQAQALPELVHCVNDAERISDIAVKIYRKTARIQRQGLSEDILAATSDIIARLRVFAHETTHVLRKGGTLKHAPAVTEDTITRAAKALSRQYSETLANAAGDRPHDTAFLTVLAGIRDVNRHIGNIAERVPALG